MSGTNGFDLTTLVGMTFPGLNVGNVNLDASSTIASSGVYTVAGEIANQGETRNGVANNTFIITAATNGPPPPGDDANAADPNAVGNLTVTETQNGAPQPSYVLNVVGYSNDAILTGLATTYNAGNDTAPYALLYELSDVNLGLHASDNPNPPSFPQMFNKDPTVFGYTPPGGVAPCFAAGTPILTVEGERAVESLAVGDRVMTCSGEALAVRWVGHRRVRPRAGDAPVRIAPHAFGPGQPHCAITLSPDHAVFLEGVLVPIHLLVDDELITRGSQAEITYHHVELDRHDVLLAAGLPAESYLDTGNRRAFAEGQDGVVSLYPDFLALSWEAACAPLVLHGGTLDTLRARLSARRGDSHGTAPSPRSLKGPHHVRQF